MFRELGISNDDQILMTDDFNYEEGLMQMGLDRRDAQGRLTPVYHLPLTQKMYDTLAGNKKLVSRIVMEPENLSGQLMKAIHWNKNRTVSTSTDKKQTPTPSSWTTIG